VGDRGAIGVEVQPAEVEEDGVAGALLHAEAARRLLEALDPRFDGLDAAFVKPWTPALTLLRR
jgi:hypothetical protein